MSVVIKKNTRHKIKKGIEVETNPVSSKKLHTPIERLKQEESIFRNLNSKFDIVSYNHLFYIYATVSGKIASRGSTLAAGNQPAPEFPFYVSPSLRNDSHHLHFLLHAGIYMRL